MMAVMNPEGIYQCTKRGFHIQTTPLAGNHQLLMDQVDGFNRAKSEMGNKRRNLTLSLSRLAFVSDNVADRWKKVEQAHDYYSRFDNIYTGPGIVEGGMIKPLPRAQSIEELDKSLLICTPQQMIDELSVYSDLGIHRVILNMNFGAEQSETLDNIQRFAEEVMPHFTTQTQKKEI
jgi:alkanesulfonate monooxygenase SsuD/methylene tetrahydromethanopterin reductase-like flavin-dependent oxidoreductase (luciferase family)